MRGVNVGGVMQLQPAAGINNGFLQSIPVQNIPGLGNIQVISAVQPTTIQPAAATPTSVHIEGAENGKWQILQTIQSNGTTIATPQQAQQQTQVQQQQQQQTQQHVTTVAASGEDGTKPHRRRVACTCPNCGDGDRYVEIFIRIKNQNPLCKFDYFFLQES